MVIETGYSFYGQKIGILVFNGVAPRIPGDPAHSATFPFPVRYEVVEGSFMSLVREDEKTRTSLLNAVQRLKAQGIKAIAGDCGLMSLYQTDLASLGLPVVASPLCQLPMVWQLLGRSGRIGVITGHSGFLNQNHFTASGCEGIPMAIQGMENMSHFSQVVIHGGNSLDPKAMEQDVMYAVEALLKNAPDTKAIVLECSNLATYSHAIAQFTNLMVFDIISAIIFMEYGINPPRYNLQ